MSPYSYRLQTAVITGFLVLVTGALAWTKVEATARNPAEAVLVSMLVAENGWQHERDQRAQLFAIHRLAKREGLDIVATVKKHIPELRAGFPRPHRAWLRHLDGSCREPEGWRRGDWHAGWVSLCSQVAARVRAYYAGKLEDPCKGAPDQWRSRRFPKLQRAARRKGWRRIGCGRTLHVYWEMR